jgi:hypothetical protein
MEKTHMAITLMMEVTIEGFSDEASAKGNHTARGMTCEVKSAKGCDAAQVTAMPTQFGNGGSILFLTKDKGLVAKLNKAKKSPADEIAALRAEIAALKAGKKAKPAAEKSKDTPAESAK